MTLPGITFDTGALIALERRNPRMWNTFRRAQQRHRPVTVPTTVVAEWWRGRTDVRKNILRAVRVEDLTAPLAQLAGEAMAHVKGATAIDAIVMASAASRGDVVYTSDVTDLEKLRAYFPTVRVLRPSAT